MGKYSGVGMLSSRTGRAVICGVLSGVLVTFVAMLLSALLLSIVDFPEGASGWMSAICIGLGALLSGFVSAKVNRQKGLIVGLVSGILMYGVFVFVALALGSAVSMTFVVRLIVAVLMSAVGGVLGINIHRKKRYV